MTGRIVFLSRAFSSSRKQHVYLRKVCEDYMNKLVDVCKSSAKDDTKEQAYGKAHFEECPGELYNHKPNKEESVAMLPACLQGYHEVIWKVVTESSLQKRHCRPTCVPAKIKLKFAKVTFHTAKNRRKWVKKLLSTTMCMQIDKSMQLTTYHHTSCLSLHLYIQVQFMYACFCPTSVCGVLVFGSVYPVRLLASSFRARCVTQLCHTPSFTYTTLPGDIHLRFAWQAWHFQTSPHSVCVAGVTLVALGWLWWRAWVPLVAGDAAAGVALPDIHTLCAWHGTYGTGLAPVARLGAAGRRWRCGRRGTSRHPHFVCVAWHLWHRAGSCGALGHRWSPVTLRHFAWQA